MKEEKFHFTEHPGLKSLDLKKEELKKKIETLEKVKDVDYIEGKIIVREVNRFFLIINLIII